MFMVIETGHIYAEPRATYVADGVDRQISNA